MHGSFDVCIAGGGPAGSAMALRMVQLGFRVCVIERCRFPRQHLGESLSPGVLPLLAAVGIDDAVQAAALSRVERVAVRWGVAHFDRTDLQGGFIADRAVFDECLLNHARACGAEVLQPAALMRSRFDGCEWDLSVASAGGTLTVRTRFLVDARGRSGRTSSARCRSGLGTLALYAYWKNGALRNEPRIESGAQEWYWGVPLPSNLYNTLIFLDRSSLVNRSARSLDRHFQDLLSRSDLMRVASISELVGPVRAIDATAYLDTEPVTENSIKIGDAALALDPLSSTGVQMAIQTALSGSVVANTLIRMPERRHLALEFYRNSLADAWIRHRHWSASHYANVARTTPTEFWRSRAESPQVTEPQNPSTTNSAPGLAGDVLHLSSLTSFVDLPCIEGNFVIVKTAISHPSLSSPVAFLSDQELAPLLENVLSGITPYQLALSWCPRIHLERGIAIVDWLLRHGILVSTPDTCSWKTPAIRV
jgi:flavin-dependent dehydrogenase